MRWHEQDELTPVTSGSHLEHSQQGLGEVVESASFGHSLVKIKLSPEKLHAQQGKDDDEEEEEQQQRGDGLHGIKQAGHQVAERRPVSAEGQNRSCDLVTETRSNHQCGILADLEGRGGQRDCSPRDFEDPQETYAAEDRDTERGHDGELHQDGLHDAATHHETVKAIKQGHKVGLQPQAVHLHEHLQREHCQENFVGNLCGEAEQQNLSQVQVQLAMSLMSWQMRAGPTLNFGQPVWLVVVLGGNGEGVEEHQDDDQPVKHDGLHSRPTLPTAEAVPAPPLTTGRKTDLNTTSLIFYFCRAWWWNDSVSADRGDYREFRLDLTNKEKTHGSVAIGRNLESWQMRKEGAMQDGLDQINESRENPPRVSTQKLTLLTWILT